MSRLLPIEHPGAWYHVMSQGRRREKIFFSSKDFELFINVLNEKSITGRDEEDVKLWIKQDVYPADEIGARFFHRLVAIHPSASGNGHHARLVAALLLVHIILKQPHFTWSSRNLIQVGECRKRYISALQAADQHDYAPSPLMQRHYCAHLKRP